MGGSDSVSEWIKVVFGLLILLIGLYFVIVLRYDVWTIIKGLFGPTLFFIGLLIFIIGVSDIRN